MGLWDMGYGLWVEGLGFMGLGFDLDPRSVQKKAFYRCWAILLPTFGGLGIWGLWGSGKLQKGSTSKAQSEPWQQPALLHHRFSLTVSGAACWVRKVIV